MNEKVKGLGGKVKDFFVNMSKKTRILLGVVLAAIVVGAVVIALILNNAPYTVLFTGLTGEEARSIASILEENGATDYRMQGSDTILVPKSQEMQLKAKVLLAGYPKNGFAYQTYRSGISAMSTDTERNIALLQDLQDRMAGVIRQFDGVGDAVVSIQLGSDQRYILDSENAVPATASVMVRLRSGAKLSDQVATAIRNLVSHSVKDLKIDNVDLSDNMGNRYSGESMGGMESAQLKLSLEEQINNQVRTQIIEVLAPFYGEDNVRVGVFSNVDVSHTVQDSTKYTSPDGAEAGKGIIGSTIYDDEVIKNSDAAAGGVAGTETNSDINTYVDNNLQVDGTETLIRSSGQDDALVNTDKTQTERVGGVVTDLSVSVSINRTVAGAVDDAQLRSQVARAAGITVDQQGDKISIMVAPFYNPEAPVIPDPAPTGLLSDWMIYAAAAGAAFLLVLLILISVLRRKSKKKKSKQLNALLENVVYSPNDTPQAVAAGADIMNIRTEKSMELRKDIRQFAEENPEIAAQMIRSWLKGGEEKDG